MPSLRLVLILALLLLGCSPSGGGDSGGAYDPVSSTPGFVARDYLSASTYDSLTIEIQYVAGYAPSTNTLNALKSFLASHLNKPGGITVVLDTPLAATGKTAFSLAEVKAFEQQHRQRFADGQTAVAYFSFLDGDFSENGQVLGVTYGPTSVAMFGRTLHANSGALGQPSRDVLETTVMEHEFGHLLGLVNTGTSPVNAHQDTAHGAHCTNTSCLMYWQVDTSNFIANLLGGTVPTLDADCAQDLRANGGK